MLYHTYISPGGNGFLSRISMEIFGKACRMVGASVTYLRYIHSVSTNGGCNCYFHRRGIVPYLALDVVSQMLVYEAGMFCRGICLPELPLMSSNLWGIICNYILDRQCSEIT